jgi:hypothetical protein
MRKLLVLACAMALILPSAGAQVVTLFTEDWSAGDGPVTGQASVTGSGATYAVAESLLPPQVDITGGALVGSVDGGSSSAYVIMTSPDAAYTAIDLSTETVRVQFDWTPTADPADRATGANVMIADGPGAGNGWYINPHFRPGSYDGRVEVGTLWSGIPGNAVQIYVTSPFVQNTTYTITVTITKDAGGDQVTLTIPGALPAGDSAVLLGTTTATALDTVAFYYGRRAQATMDNLTISTGEEEPPPIGPAVPAVALIGLGLLAGAIALGGAHFVRRRA